MENKLFHYFRFGIRFGAMCLLLDCFMSCYRADSVQKGLAPLAIVFVLFGVLGAVAFGSHGTTRKPIENEFAYDEDALRLHKDAHHGNLIVNESDRIRSTSK